MRFFQLSLFQLLIKGRGLVSRRSRAVQNNLTTPEQDAVLKEIWLKVRRGYFPEREDLDSYEICWSRRRQKRTLASCNVRQRRVIVAKELNHHQHITWLEPLLYHEMCHAYLGKNVERRGGKRAWHGAEFRALERRHPGIKQLDHWIKSGGWHTAVRSERTRSMHRKKAHERTKFIQKNSP